MPSNPKLRTDLFCFKFLENLSISLAGRSSRMGLPNFASYYAPPPFVLPDPIVNCGTASFTAPTSLISCFNSATYTFLWNFGDGNTSVAQNPIHTYLSPGTYIVSLQIIGTCSTIILNKTINTLNGTNVSIYTN